MRCYLTVCILGCLLLTVGLSGSAAEKSSQSAHSWFQRGQDAMTRHDALSALVCFRAAVALDPSDLIDVLTLAQTDVALGRYDDARQALLHSERTFTHLDDRAQISASLADTECAWGLALAAKGAYDSAIRHYQAAIAYDSLHRGANGAFDFEQLAAADLAIGAVDDAEADLSRAHAICAQLLAIAAARHHPISTAWASCAMATVAPRRP